MDPTMHDEDILWRRAFADSSGLFDNLFFGPLLNNAEALPPLAAAPAAPPPPPPTNNNNAVLAPSPALTSVSFAPQVLLPCLTVPAVALSEDRLPAPPQRIPSVSSATSLASAGGGLGSPGPMQQSPLKNAARAPAKSGAMSAAKPAILAAEASEDGQVIPQQRGGESCARKRDRAKLLRQQMNDGLDNLHEALVEISTSGANPSAAATTSLFPTRGPRRATVVACSSGLVRELISTCVALRAENSTLKERLATAALVAASHHLSSSPCLDSETDLAAGGSTANGNRDGDKNNGDRAGSAGAASVFGQLLALGVFGFLGPQSLEEGRRVCRDWRDKCTWDCCWSNLCVSRWRLCPEERHAEVWRADKTSEERAVVSPPAPPPPWRQVYGRLHKDLRVPTGAFSPVHMIIGRSLGAGVAVWVALSRRSNGMTGRSVMGHGSTGVRTTEVIALRAVVQRVDEGPAVHVHPRAFTVREIQCLHSSLAGGSSSTAMTTAREFPPLPQSEERFLPSIALNSGGSSRVPVQQNTAIGTSWGCAKPSSATAATTTSLALYEYATVDFFIEAAGCPTEADFLRRETCVDVRVWGVGGVSEGDMQVLPVVLTPRPLEGAAVLGAGVDMGRPAKRRGSMEGDHDGQGFGGGDSSVFSL